MTDEQVGFLANCKSCGDAIAALITNLLDFSMIESGKFVLKRDMFNFQHTVQFLQSLLQPIATSSQIQFTCTTNEILRDKSLFIWGDWLRIQQSVINLVTNSFKYSLKGAQVRLSFQGKLERDQLILSIDVEDTGIGKKNKK